MIFESCCTAILRGVDVHDEHTAIVADAFALAEAEISEFGCGDAFGESCV